jgi:hypothetical protein
MADKKYKKKALEDLIVPREVNSEPEDNEPLSDQDKILLRDFHKKVKSNEIQPSRQEEDEIRLKGTDKEVLDERGFYNTRKLIDSGKVGGKDVEQLFKRIKKSKSNPI